MRTRGGEFVPGYLPGLSENDAKVNAAIIEQKYFNSLSLSLSLFSVNALLLSKRDLSSLHYLQRVG